MTPTTQKIIPLWSQKPLEIGYFCRAFQKIWDCRYLVRCSFHRYWSTPGHISYTYRTLIQSCGWLSLGVKERKLVIIVHLPNACQRKTQQKVESIIFISNFSVLKGKLSQSSSGISLFAESGGLRNIIKHYVNRNIDMIWMCYMRETFNWNVLFPQKRRFVSLGYIRRTLFPSHIL